MNPFHSAVSHRTHRHPNDWISLSVLINDRRQTALDEDEPTTPFDRRNSQVVLNMTHNIKKQLFLYMEEPSSSSTAFWINVLVSVLILLSATIITLETIPAFRSTESNRVWFNIETLIVSIFSLEYILRMFAHSDSFKMFKEYILSPLTIIDMISIVPFFIELIGNRNTTYEFRFLILRLFRLLRLFKTYKYTSSIVMTIEVMVLSFRRSRDALYALFIFLVTCVVLFSTLLYFAERGIWDDNLQIFVDPSGNPSAFDSIPSTFWFVMATITTTGYGNMVPTTFIGKLITFPAMIFGVLLIALPSIIMGRHFTVVWETMKRQQMYKQLEGMMNEGDQALSMDYVHQTIQTELDTLLRIAQNNQLLLNELEMKLKL
ncbi:hypothetical protein BDB01DRAFT_797022 [Pilobolus umbonatus]|nr:hypothetical protein BDB01DRAFT_797022 [Pilobolus umbonatus]